MLRSDVWLKDSRARSEQKRGLRSTFLGLLVHICSHGTGWGRVSTPGIAHFIFCAGREKLRRATQVKLMVM